MLDLQSKRYREHLRPTVLTTLDIIVGRTPKHRRLYLLAHMEQQALRDGKLLEVQAIRAYRDHRPEMF